MHLEMKKLTCIINQYIISPDTLTNQDRHLEVKVAAVHIVAATVSGAMLESLSDKLCNARSFEWAL